MAVALAGVGLMVGGPGGSHGIGLALSILMTFCFALSVVITRHRRDISMAPAICLSQILVLARDGAVRASALGRVDRPAADRRARRRPDRARARVPDDRGAADPGRRGGVDHAARGRARAALGLAGAVGAAEHRDADRRHGRDRSGRRAGAAEATRPMVELELFDRSHLAAFAALLDDPDVVRFTRLPVSPPPDYAETWFAAYEAGRRDGTREAFAIVDGATARVRRDRRRAADRSRGTDARARLRRRAGVARPRDRNRRRSGC